MVFNHQKNALSHRVPYQGHSARRTIPFPLEKSVDYEVTIVGAGPVGLMLACDLGNRGIRTLIVDQREDLPRQSMAIGITPPSLEIFRQINLDRELLAGGQPIKRAVVHEERETIGDLTFENLPEPFSYILSVPQAHTIAVLDKAVRKIESVTYMRGVGCVNARSTEECAEVYLEGKEVPVTSQFLVACDGAKSQVRKAMAVPVDKKIYGQRFVMADFTDRSDLNGEAHLFFSSNGPVESFPLPNGMRRWITLCDDTESELEENFLEMRVTELTGYTLNSSDRTFLSTFIPRRELVNDYVIGRVAFCGDAAHCMSPIGGQGMNTGFADAEILAEVLAQALRNPVTALHAFEIYDCTRRKAYMTAANRAAAWMWMGTRKGTLASRARSTMLHFLLGSSIIRRRLAISFSMLTIPFGRRYKVFPDSHAR